MTHALASLFWMVDNLLARRATRLAAPAAVEAGERMSDLRTKMVAVTDEAASDQASGDTVSLCVNPQAHCSGQTDLYGS